MKNRKPKKTSIVRGNVEKSALADRFINEVLFPLSLDEGKVLAKRGKFETVLIDSLAEFADEETGALGRQLYRDGFFLIREMKPETYECEPYYRLLSSLSGRVVDDVSFDFETIEPYSLFASQDKIDGGNGKDVSPLGYFSRPFSFPCIKKSGRIWMSLVPHEIETMRQPIGEAHGVVAVLGLGLGYFAFACAEKQVVTRVKVFEKDPAIIALFKESLLPLFPQKDKIEIIEKDALTYDEDGPFDFVFADLWHDVEDGLPLYQKLLEREIQNVPVSYWIEDTIRLTLGRFLLLLNEGESEKSLREEMPEWAEIIQKCSSFSNEERKTARNDQAAFRALLKRK